MIYVTKFRANDLNPSKGKQIEFNIGVVRNFFHFATDQEFAEFKCYSLADSSIERTIKASFTKSPARGDYKIYQNADESMQTIPCVLPFFLSIFHPADCLKAPSCGIIACIALFPLYFYVQSFDDSAFRLGLIMNTCVSRLSAAAALFNISPLFRCIIRKKEC